MAAWQYDLFLVATEPVEFSAVSALLSAALPVRPSPSAKLMMWGEPDGDRVDFWTGQSPVELLVSFDLRTPSEAFRHTILQLAAKFGFRRRNADDVEIAPTDAALMGAMQASPARAWVDDPPVEEDVEEEE